MVSPVLLVGFFPSRDGFPDHRNARLGVVGLNNQSGMSMMSFGGHPSDSVWCELDPAEPADRERFLRLLDMATA